MKSQFHLRSFLSGALASALVLGSAVSALAISGRMTIEVLPINIQVNGETFQPTDVNGYPVPVFAYHGTTYAPLRALAEAYGLEVGYDPERNMATVTDPDAKPAPDTAALTDYSDWSAEEEAAYQEFKGMWEIEKGEYLSGIDLLGESYKRQDYLSHLVSDLEFSKDMFAENQLFAERLALEYFDGSTSIYFQFLGKDQKLIGDIAIKQSGEILH